jgi:hypothetical protein
MSADNSEDIEALLDNSHGCPYCSTRRFYSGYRVMSGGLLYPGPHHPFEDHYTSCPDYLAWRKEHGAEWDEKYRAWAREWSDAS